MQDGTDTPWFLLDVSRQVKPLVFQTRISYQMQSLNKDSDNNVFMHDEYLYGIRARVNAGYGYSSLLSARTSDAVRLTCWSSGVTDMADNQQIATVPLLEIETGKAESWVQLLPSGQFDLNDKRGLRVVKDMASVIVASSADLERGMPVDMDHALDRHKESEVPAAGWIEELAARDDGIYARIAWTPTGKAKIERREYRFISPVVMATKAGEVMAVKRAGLTNAPATAMKALFSVEDDDVREGMDDLQADRG